MKTQTDPALVGTQNYFTRTPIFKEGKFKCPIRALFAAILVFSCVTVKAQTGDCSDCPLSFGSITVYHTLQQGSNMGFGFEAGMWNKEENRFSYFMGAKMQWLQASAENKKENSAENIRYSVYVKGQFEVVNRFYVNAAPEFVNLSSFEARVGLRYVLPLTKTIGLGIEPGYSFVQKQYSLNTNIHFALW